MVAIFTGLGSGFERGSGAALGSGGLLGSSVLGRGGEGAFLNAATGNLVLSRQDEFLVGRGPDVALARTYNSLGNLAHDDNGDLWRQSSDRRVFGLTGTVNTTGSTVKRLSADGSEITYTYDDWDPGVGTDYYYRATDGAGAHDKLVYTPAVTGPPAVAAYWTWTDGSTQIKETYGIWKDPNDVTFGMVSGGDSYLARQYDTDGNSVTFRYDAAGKLDKVTTADGSWIQYSWTGSNITTLTTGYTELATSTAKTLTRTRYAYDGANRLINVTTDLTPGDNSVSDANTYWTSYTYDGASKRVASITQKDGSSLAIGYDVSGRVISLTQSVGVDANNAAVAPRVTTIAYVSSTQTNITDPRGAVTSLYYDAAGQLTRVVAPPATTGATAQEVNYTYDGAGNVLTAITKSGATTLATLSYQYDAQGNVTQITDANGNVTTRSYDANNSVLLETRTGSSASAGSTSLYTRYVYDGENHLRYVISAEGRVSEYRYKATGELERTIAYPQHAYAPGSTLPTEAQMNSWRDGLADRSTTMVTRLEYDARGGLTNKYVFGAANSAGVELTSEGYRADLFVYDQSGQLLARGLAPNGFSEAFVYDGLGRLTASTDLNGGTTTIVFNDAATTTTVTTAAGYTTVSTYNKSGELITRTDSGAYTENGEAKYFYDKNGQVRRVSLRNGAGAVVETNLSYILYDKTGRKIADIGQDGQLIEYRYDALGRVVATARFNTILSAGQISSLSDPNSEIELASIRPAANANDLWQWSVYDTGGRVIETILGDGSVTTYGYDQADRLIATTRYSNRLSQAQIDGFKITPPAASVLPTADATKDRITRSFYDGDGRLIGALNAEGHLSEIVYDSAGQKIQEIGYANPTVQANRASGSFALLKTGLANAAKDVSTRFVYDGQGLLRFSIDALNRVSELVYSKETTWGANGLVRQTIAYAAPLGAVANYTYATIKSAVAGLASSANDRVSYNVYNDRGQLSYTVDATGAVTGFGYDVMGRVTKTTQFASLFNTATIGVDSAWKGNLDAWAGSNGANARITRNYYAARGDLIYTIDAEGYVTGFAYEAQGRVFSKTRYANKIVASDATTIANIDAANKGAGATSSYRYDALGRQHDSYDANGTRFFTFYNANGLRSYAVAAYGQGADEAWTGFEYDIAGRLKKETKAAGTAEASVTQYAYDGLGNVATVTDARGFVTSFAYDKVGRVTTRTDAVSTSVARTTTYEYDAFGRGVKTIDPRGNASFAYFDQLGRVTAAIDAEGYLTRTAYTAFGEVQSVTRSNLKAINFFQSTWPAGGAGFTLTQESVDGWLTNVARNQHGEVPAGSSVAYGGKVGVYNGDRADGLISVTAGESVSFNLRGRALAAGITLLASIQFMHADGTYSWGGFVDITSTNWANVGTSVTVPTGAIAAFVNVQSYRADANVNGSFDIAFRDVTITRSTGGVFNTDPRAPASTADATTTFAYDKLGRRVSETNAENGVTQYQFNTFGQLVKLTDPGGGLSYFYYDSLGRVKLAIDAEGYATETTYTALDKVATVTRSAVRANNIGNVNVLPTLTADVLDATTTYAYDAAGRLIDETNALGVVTHYVYDRRGNLTQKVEGYGLAAANMRTTTYAYNDLNLLTSITHDAIAEGSSVNGVSTARVDLFYYDAAGNLVEKRDAMGARALYWYDALGRVKYELVASETISSVQHGTLTRNTYDANGNVIQRQVFGTLVALPAGLPGTEPAEPTSSRSSLYTYDKLGRVTESKTLAVRRATYNGATLSVDASDVTLTTAYEYDAMSNVIRVKDGKDAETFSYFDKLGRKTAQVDAERYRTDWVYDANGNVTAETRYGTKLATAPTTAALPSVTLNASSDRTTNFTYDKMGRRLTETRLNVAIHNAGSVGTTINANAVITYTYNALGAVLSKTEASGDSIAYAYDKLGRLTSEQRSGYTDHTGASVAPRVEYTYNALNNLSQSRAVGNATAADRTTLYTYAAGGLLTAKTDAENFTRTYIYDAAGRVVREQYTRVKPDGASVDEAVGYDYDLMGRIVAQGIMVKANGVYTRSQTNALGESIDTARMRYNAYGEVSERGINGVYAEKFEYDNAGRVVRTNSGDGAWKYFMYDGAGNQTLMIQSVGTDLNAADKDTLAEVLALWTGGTTTIATTNVAGVVATITRYDARNQAIEVREPKREHGATVGVQDLTTTRAYNAFGETAYEINAAGARVDYTYNTMGRLIKIESPSVEGRGANGNWITGYNADFTPNASATTATTFRPVEHRYYDASGRLVANRDANGNLTRYTLLAGTGYGGAQALISETYNPDGGVIRTKYDIHGDVRRIESPLYNATTAPQFVTTQSFDKLGRLIQLNHPGGLIDYYAYDGLGQRIKRWNSQYGAALETNVERTFYDQQGRLVDHYAIGGDRTQMSYGWSNTIATTGMATFGGWTQTTTYANGKTLTEQSDMFGRAIAKTDLGANVTGFTYDKAGRLTQRSGGAALNFNYYNTGRLKAQFTMTGTVASMNWNRRETLYDYDRAGNLKAEKLTETGESYSEGSYWNAYDQAWEYYTNHNTWNTPITNATANYDALGRLLSWNEAGAASIPAASHTYEYDANGNIRRSVGTFRTLNAQGQVSASATTQDYWYRYDAMNRVTTQKGTLVSGQIQRGAQGLDIGYDLAGNRAYTLKSFADYYYTTETIWAWPEPYDVQTAHPFTNTRREEYTYDAAGRVTQVKSAAGTYTGAPVAPPPAPGTGALQATYAYDPMGRLTSQNDYSGGVVVFSRALSYNSKSQVLSETSNTKRGTTTYESIASFAYGAGAAYALGAATEITTTNRELVNSTWTVKPTTKTNNAYQWRDGAVQQQIVFDADNNPATANTSSTYGYVTIGGQAQLSSVGVADGRPRSIAFVNDLNGQVIRRDESDNNASAGDPHEMWYRFGGREQGYVGNNGTLETDYAASIALRTQAPSTTAFRNGTTAGASHADFDQSLSPITSYEQGAAGGGYVVRAGDTLASIAGSLYGDASLWYKIAEVNGLGAQTALAEGQALRLPAGVMKAAHNSATFAPYDPNEIIGDTAPTTPVQPQPKKKKCGGLGAVLLAVIAVVVVAIVAPHAIAAVSNLTGGAAAGGGAVQAGAVAKAIAGGVAVSSAGATTAGAIVGGAIAGAAGSIVSQGIGVATGIQDKFSWNAVALAAIGGGVGGGVGAQMSGAHVAARAVVGNVITQGIGVATGLQEKFSWAGVAAAGVGAWAGAAAPAGPFNVVRNGASLIADAATRSLIEGSDFGDNVLAALPNVIGQTIGNAIAGRLSGSGATTGTAGKSYNGSKQLALDPSVALCQAQAHARRGGGFFGWLGEAWDGALNWLGDLTGFDNGRFSAGNLGLRGANAAAIDEAWDGVVIVTAPARRAVDDFFAGWNTSPVLPRREERLSAAPAYIPVISEWQHRQGYASYTASLADGMRGQRSIFNSPFQNFGLDARAAMYNVESAFQRPAALLAPVDATFGRGIEAVHPYMNRYQASEGLATAASVMVGNPEAMAASLGPRASLGPATTFYHGTSAARAESIALNGIDLSLAREGTDFGAAFYTSTSYDDAFASAFRIHGSDTVVMEFRVPNSELAGLNSLTFQTADASWESFIRYNRFGEPAPAWLSSQPYDMVTGPYYAGGTDVIRTLPRSVPQTSVNTQQAADLFDAYRYGVRRP
jgi:YD repeat-containing protein